MSENELLAKLKKHMDNIPKEYAQKVGGEDYKGMFVPMEVWRLTNEVYLETLREIYEMVHQMNMDRGYTMDMQIGDVRINLCGDSKDREEITKKGQEIIGDVFDRITKLGDSAMKLVAAREKERRKVDESNKGFG